MNHRPPFPSRSPRRKFTKNLIHHPASTSIICGYGLGVVRRTCGVVFVICMLSWAGWRWAKMVTERGRHLAPHGPTRLWNRLGFHTTLEFQTQRFQSRVLVGFPSVLGSCTPLLCPKKDTRRAAKFKDEINGECMDCRPSYTPTPPLVFSNVLCLSRTRGMKKANHSFILPSLLSMLGCSLV